VPFLPPKCYRLFGPDAEFLEARKSALQRYLDLLAASKELAQCPDVEAFIQQVHGDRKEGSLPSQLPDVPAGQHDPAHLQSVDRVLGSTRAAFRSLFLFQQALEVDPFLSNRIAIIDSRRRQMMTASKTLRRSLPEVEGLAHEVERRDPPLGEFLMECSRMARAALKWIENIETEESPLIKHFLKEAKDIRPISWYEAQVAAALAGGREDWGLALPEPVQQLIATIKVEREYRRQVGQLIAVQILRELQHSLSDKPPAAAAASSGAMSSVATIPDSPAAAAATVAYGAAGAGAAGPAMQPRTDYSPQTILEALQKRTRLAVGNVDGVLSGVSTGGDAHEVGDRLNQLDADLRELLQIVADLKGLLEKNPTADWSRPLHSGDEATRSDEDDD
jgi:hypothetical protein